MRGGAGLSLVVVVDVLTSNKKKISSKIVFSKHTKNTNKLPSVHQ